MFFFTFIKLLLLLLIPLQTVQARCPNLCSGHGTCDQYLRCTCYDGWQAADCSLRTCPSDLAWSDEAVGTDIAHLPAECSNRGLCNRETGQCECREGFSGIGCQRTICANDCNHHGKCVSMNEMAATQQNNDARSYSYSTIWDAKKLFGCVCDNGYHGYDCSLKSCPSGDDPLTTNQVNEVQLIKCVASDGYFVLYYQNQPSEHIYATDGIQAVTSALEAIPALGPGSLQVSFTSGQPACTVSGSNIIQIEFMQNFHSLPPLTSCHGGLVAGGYIEVAARVGETVTDDQRIVYKPIKGTKEDDVCANRGVCDTAEGSCNCFDTNGDSYASSDGYGAPGLRGDCGYAMTTIAHCPGEVACSGHGKCNSADKVYRCECAEGWSGGDCSERVCPTGPSWFSYPSSDDSAHNTVVECSNRGLCDDAIGECTCGDGFFGAACEYLACGGGTSEPCNGHGRCLSMAELALVANANGDATSFSYGLDGNNPMTWDAGRIYGCHCDEGYEGYDCSLRTCPRGDDPGTYGQESEVQLIQCQATGGNFTLNFRQSTTDAIPYDAPVSIVESALNSLPTINNGLSITFSQGSLACDPSGTNIIQAIFFAVFGDLPSLVGADNNLTGTLTIATGGDTLNAVSSIKGTKENDVCSNRGLCDSTTGLCNCFQGFSSSDGRGNEGSLGECGSRVAKYSSYTSPYYT